MNKFKTADFEIAYFDKPEIHRFWFNAEDLCKIIYPGSIPDEAVSLYCRPWQFRRFDINGTETLYVCQSGVMRLIDRSSYERAAELKQMLIDHLIEKTT